MSFKPPKKTPSKTVKGNATNSTAKPGDIALTGNVFVQNGKLGKNPVAGRVLTGDGILLASDNGTSIIINSAVNATLTIPAGLPTGMRVRLYQGGSGQIGIVGANGTALVNASTQYTVGPYTSGYYVDLEATGTNEWIVLGNTTAQLLTWNIYGTTSIKEGDSVTYCISYPSEVNNYPNGVTIQINGTNFDSAGFDKTLAQGIATAVTLDPFLSFNGTNTLTVKPGAKNPIILNFFAVPTLTAIGDRTATIGIASPSVGSVPSSANAVATFIKNVSKPTAPNLLFPTSTVTTSGSVTTGSSTVTLSDASSVKVLSTVTGTNIPALTWVTAINGNVLTLSNAITGTIGNATSLTITPPGFWMDFSDASYVTKDGSNKVSVATDKINGYTVTQSDTSKQPIWTANTLNALGGLTLNGSSWLEAVVPGQFTKTTTAQTNSAGNTITLNNVTNVAVGMLVNDDLGIIKSTTKVASIAGNVVTLNKAITNNNLLSGATITFSPVGANHPLINLMDQYAAMYTVIIVAKTTNSATGGYVGWDAISLQNSSASDHAFVGDAAAQEMISATSAVGNPYIWEYVSDGSQHMIYVNGQNPLTFATLTADAVAGGYTLTVDDSSGFGVNASINAAVPGIFYQRIDTITSATSIDITHNPAYQPWISKTLPSGTKVFGQSRAIQMPAQDSTHPRAAAKTSQKFALGSIVGPAFSNYCNGSNTNIGVTPDGSLVGGTSVYPLHGEIYEIIVLPRMLTMQEKRGVTLYLSNKWGVTTTTTTSGSTAAGAISISVADASALYYGQTLTGITGIVAGTMVTGVNRTTNVIKIDTPTTAIINSGTTLTFKGPGFQPPKILDINQFYPTYRDDFSNGLVLTNGTGWKPYYGLPSQPADTYSTAYSATGHGSTNGGGIVSLGYANEAQWYLDVLNWQPWLLYNPFDVQKSDGSPSGELTITASPAASAIRNLIGYAPQPNPYMTYTSGYIRQETNQQYGYWEARIRNPNVDGMWPAYWLTASDGIWPPELDIMEANGTTPGFVTQTGHSNRTLVGVPTYTDFPNGSGHMLMDATTDYVTYGVELSATSVDFYLNREKTFSFPTQIDYHTYWNQQLNLAVFGPSTNAYRDNVTPGKMNIDYTAQFRRNRVSPTVPGATQAETTALLAAMTVQPVTLRANAINTLIASLKTYKTSFGPSLWDALDFFFVPAAHDAQAARINWKNPAQIGTVVGTPTFTVDRGYKGSYGVSYIETGINLSTAGYGMTSTNNHIGAAGSGLVNITASQSSSVSSAVSGVETNAHYNMRLGPYWCYGRNYNGTGNYTFTVNGSQSGSVNRGYCVTSRNEYQMQQYWYGNTGNVLSQFPIYGNTANAIDNATLVLGNSTTAIVSCAHGGKFLTQDDIGYLYNLVYAYLNLLGAL